MATNSSAIAITSDTPSSTPIVLSSSDVISSTPESSAAAIASSTPAPAPASSANPVVTSVISASAAAPTTKYITSAITVAPTIPGESPSTVYVVVTTVPSNQQTSATAAKTSTAKSSTTSGAAGLQTVSSKESGGGLSTAGKTAIAVVIPVVVVAALVLVGLFLWKKRKQRKDGEEARRNEVEEYGFNPNNDPTLPAVAGSVMTEDHSGYRGWGNTTNPSNRKASTTLSSGFAGVSDTNSNAGGYHSPNSPTQVSEGHSGDPLVGAGRRETMDSETIGALGTAPVAGQNRSDIRRGPSNASSSYSAGNRSDNSGEVPMPMNNPQEYYNEPGYYQGPYGDGTYGGGQPVIRDVSARRNTRIENPSIFPQQGNSGIAQNF